MRKQILTIGVSSVAALALLSSPAYAATWTVTSSSLSITAAPSGTVTARVIKPGGTLRSVTTCNAGSISGTLTATGSGLSNPLATVPSGALGLYNSARTDSKCSGPNGSGVSLSATTSWTLNGASYASGVTTGTLDNVKAHAVATTGCTVDATASGGGAGTINGTYTNSTGILATTGSNLVVTTATGCLTTEAVVGDTITLIGSLKVSPAVTITSP